MVSTTSFMLAPLANRYSPALRSERALSANTPPTKMRRCASTTPSCLSRSAISSMPKRGGIVTILSSCNGPGASNWLLPKTTAAPATIRTSTNAVNTALPTITSGLRARLEGRLGAGTWSGSKAARGLRGAMRLGSIYDPTTPSGRAEIGAPGSPAPSTTRSGDAEAGMPDGAVAELGAAAATLADVGGPGSGKSPGLPTGAAASLLTPSLATPAAGAFACIVARRDISAARPRMPFGAPARDGSAGCRGAEPVGEGCGGKPAATRCRAVEGSDGAEASRRAGSRPSPAGGALCEFTARPPP